jgi:biotin carboxylase
MHARRVLVVYDHGSVAPKRIAAAARDAGCELIFLTADSEHARSMRRTLGLFGAVVGSASEVRELRPAGIVTFSETQLRHTARLAEALGLDYQSPADVHALTDKAEQRRRLRAAGIDDVRGAVVAHPGDVDVAVERVGLPAVVKPLVGVSSRNTSVIRDAAQARAVVGRLLSEAGEPAVLLEEYLAGRPTRRPFGDYLGVQVVAFGGEVAPMFPMSKFAFAPPFRERGGYGPRSVEDPALIAEVCRLACAAVRCLGVRQGVAEAEIKLTAAGPRVIEVNGRLGGWVDDLANRTGVTDPLRTALLCALGEPPPAPRAGNGRLAFQYLLHAPMAATRVVSVHGVGRLRRVPAADRVYVRTRAGARVDWRTGSASALGAVWGYAASCDELAATVEEIESTDWITYESEVT